MTLQLKTKMTNENENENRIKQAILSIYEMYKQTEKELEIPQLTINKTWHCEYYYSILTFPKVDLWIHTISLTRSVRDGFSGIPPHQKRLEATQFQYDHTILQQWIYIGAKIMNEIARCEKYTLKAYHLIFKISLLGVVSYGSKKLPRLTYLHIQARK